jgi:tetrathionate reductase subunit B
MAGNPVRRRDFLLGSGAFLAGFLFRGDEPAMADAVRLPGIPANARWGYLIDTTRCIGCGNCMRACRKENDVPAKGCRTWVERYLSVEEDNEIRVQVDTPQGDGKGYPPVTGKVAKGYFVPKLCNHCAAPSCVRACPASATYVSPEGVVLVDEKWCVGCGYCVQACPYKGRFIDEEKGVASKCTWCYHRITKGLKPACALVCPTGARQFGDLTNPADPVTKAFREQRVYVLRPETGNEPQIRYTDLGREVV